MAVCPSSRLDRLIHVGLPAAADRAAIIAAALGVEPSGPVGVHFVGEPGLGWRRPSGAAPSTRAKCPRLMCTIWLPWPRLQQGSPRWKRSPEAPRG
jgi:hypothetical protein